MKDLVSTLIKWTNTDTVPEKEQPILCYTENGNIMTLKNVKDTKSWEWYVEKYHIVLYTYTLTITVQLAKAVFGALGGLLEK